MGTQLSEAAGSTQGSPALLRALGPSCWESGHRWGENKKPLRAAAVKLLGHVKSRQQAQHVEMAPKVAPRDFDTAFVRQRGGGMAPQRMGGDQVRGAKMRARVGS